MIKQYIKYILIGLFVFTYTSCDENGIFEKELYEKLVYIVSDENKIFDLVYSLDDESPASEVSVAVSGSRMIDEDVRVTLERDTLLLNKYNTSNFETEDKYAKELGLTLFDIPSMSLVISKDGVNPYETLPVYVSQKTLEALSPDSIYFIPLAIKDISTYEINTEGKNVLCRIHKKNLYAETKNTTFYTLKGYQIKVKDGVSSTSSISGSKIYHPITHNKVRTFVGNKPFTANIDSITKYAMTITVDTENKVHLEKYNNNSTTLEIEQLDPETTPNFLYQNRYDKKQNRFFLYYKYRVKDGSGTWSDWFVIQEADKRLLDEETKDI